MQAFVFAGLVATAAAAGEHVTAEESVFIWNQNTLFSDNRNWMDGDTLGGILDLNVDCINNFGDEGGETTIDEDITIAGMNLPMNGEIVLGEGTSITFVNEDAPATQTWKCFERDSACSANYLVEHNNDYIVPERAPCYNDEIHISASQTHAISWHPNQHISKIMLTYTDGTKPEAYVRSDDAVFNALWSQSIRSFSGYKPIINNDDSCGGRQLCLESCFDSCPPELNHTENSDKFFDNLEDQIAVLNSKIGTVNSTVDSFEDVLKSNDLLKALQEEQNAWTQVTSMEEGDTGKVTIDSLKVSSTDMYDLMARAGFTGDSASVPLNIQNAIHFVTTNKLVADSIAYLEKASTDVQTLWSQIDADESNIKGKPSNDADSAFYFFLGKGLKSNGLENGVEVAGEALGNDLAILGTKGSVVASSLSDTATSTHAPGAYEFKNFEMRGTLNSEDTALYISTSVLQKIFSVEVTKFALYFSKVYLTKQIKGLEAAISAKTVTPTTSPTVSPSNSPTVTPTAFPTLSPTAYVLGALEGSNGIMVGAGAGAGFLLIVMLVVIFCLLTKKSNDKPSKVDEGRNVVAFENPMYDDPAQTGVTATTVTSGGDDPGLYDEPSFNQGNDKENPMYQSQDNVNDTAGGYLDVEPDEDDDDDDEDEDE